MVQQEVHTYCCCCFLFLFDVGKGSRIIADKDNSQSWYSPFLLKYGYFLSKFSEYPLSNRLPINFHIASISKGDGQRDAMIIYIIKVLFIKGSFWISFCAANALCASRTSLCGRVE